MAKVSVNKKHQEKLDLLLKEFSKIDFNDFVNEDISSSDISNVNIEIEEAVLKALVIIKKKPFYNKESSEMDFSDTLSDPVYKLDKIDFLECFLVVKDDALEISHHRLLAAHEEKIHLK